MRDQQNLWNKVRQLTNKLNKLSIIAYADIDYQDDGMYVVTVKPYGDVKLEPLIYSSFSLIDFYEEVDSYYEKSATLEQGYRIREGITGLVWLWLVVQNAILFLGFTGTLTFIIISIQRAGLMPEVKQVALEVITLVIKDIMSWMTW